MASDSEDLYRTEPSFLDLLDHGEIDFTGTKSVRSIEYDEDGGREESVSIVTTEADPNSIMEIIKSQLGVVKQLQDTLASINKRLDDLSSRIDKLDKFRSDCQESIRNLEKHISDNISPRISKIEHERLEKLAYPPIKSLPTPPASPIVPVKTSPKPIDKLVLKNDTLVETEISEELVLKDETSIEKEIHEDPAIGKLVFKKNNKPGRPPRK